mmetsp:Transcript_229/g.683  ORF Transcript_229/g.683 Transcript_229/m.683 type:complete len:219 (+) Transcript_229:3097-3753(+)|eukprot:scaffold14068_cov119-Isochrysis_galbana.AAC.18
MCRRRQCASSELIPLTNPTLAKWAAVARRITSASLWRDCHASNARERPRRRSRTSAIRVGPARLVWSAQRRRAASAGERILATVTLTRRCNDSRSATLPRQLLSALHSRRRVSLVRALDLVTSQSVYEIHDTRPLLRSLRVMWVTACCIMSGDARGAATHDRHAFESATRPNAPAAPRICSSATARHSAWSSQPLKPCVSRRWNRRRSEWALTSCTSL